MIFEHLVSVPVVEIFAMILPIPREHIQNEMTELRALASIGPAVFELWEEITSSHLQVSEDYRDRA